MSDPRPGANGGFEQNQDDRLDSWKEIAAYLKRDVTTVQRWEKKEGLPVHRKVHDKLGSVYAFRGELDSWWRNGQRDSQQLLPTPPARASRWPVAVAAAIIAVAAIGAVSWSRFPRAVDPEPKVIPFTTMEGAERGPEFSPDGSHIAFTANFEAGPFVFIGVVNGGAPIQITRERGAGDVCWSPDGKHIAFLRNAPGLGRGVYVVPALGGPERRITSRLSANPGLAWADGKSIVMVDRAGPLARDQLFRVSIETGERHALTSADSGHGDQQPNVSPDAKRMAFVRISENQGLGDLWVASVDGGQPRQLTRSPWTIFDHDWSADGSSIIVAGEREGVNRLWRVDVATAALDTFSVGESATEVSVSRIGNRLAYARFLRDHNVWRAAGPAALEESPPTKLIASTRQDRLAAYSPDGSRIAVMSDRDGMFALWVCRADGGDCVHISRTGATLTGDARWSPKGDRLAFTRADTADEPRILIARLDNGLVEPMKPPLRAVAPAWSVDGESLLVTLIDANVAPGDREIWRVPLNGGAPVKATSATGRFPRMSGDGRFLYYTKGAPLGSLWRLDLQSQAEQKVFDDPIAGAAWTEWKGRVYFTAADRNNAWIMEIDPAKGARKRIRELGPTSLVGGLSISPDGQWLIYGRNDGPESDIVLVENYSR